MRSERVLARALFSPWVMIGRGFEGATVVKPPRKQLPHGTATLQPDRKISSQNRTRPLQHNLGGKIDRARNDFTSTVLPCARVALPRSAHRRCRGHRLD